MTNSEPNRHSAPTMSAAILRTAPVKEARRPAQRKARSTPAQLKEVEDREIEKRSSRSRKRSA